MLNTCQPINSRLKNEILTASIAQEMEKMEIKTVGDMTRNLDSSFLGVKLNNYGGP